VWHRFSFNDFNEFQHRVSGAQKHSTVWPHFYLLMKITQGIEFLVFLVLKRIRTVANGGQS